MKRKVIQLAGKTLLVSLPSKWAKSCGVNKGDEIDVEEMGRSILVTTEKPASVGKKELALSGSEEFIRRAIGVEYKKGVDELMLTFDDPKAIRIIKEELGKLMGFEIISQGEKFCLVKSVSAAVESEFDNILRRIFLVMIEMSKGICDAVSRGENSRLREIKTSELTNNKLTDFCKRLLGKKGYHDYRSTSYIYTIIWELERIADEYRKICEAMESSRERASKEALSLIRETSQFFEDFYSLFYKFSGEGADRLTKAKKQLLAESMSFLRRAKGSEAAVAHCVINIIEGTYDIAGQYYATVM